MIKLSSPFTGSESLTELITSLHLRVIQLQGFLFNPLQVGVFISFLDIYLEWVVKVKNPKAQVST